MPHPIVVLDEYTHSTLVMPICYVCNLLNSTVTNMATVYNLRDYNQQNLNVYGVCIFK